MRVERSRRSAKGIVTDFANEMMKRTNDPDVKLKLNVLATISSRMGWFDIFNTIVKFNKGQIYVPADIADEEQERKQPWWNK